MIQLLSAIFGIVLIFLVPPAGVMLLLCDRKLHRRMSAVEHRRIWRILNVSGGTLAAAGVLGIVGTAAAGVGESWTGEIDLAELVACGVAVMLSGVLLTGGRIALRAGRSLGKAARHTSDDAAAFDAESRSHTDAPPGTDRGLVRWSDDLSGTGVRVEDSSVCSQETANGGRPSSMLRTAGWLLALLPAVYFSPAFFLGMIVPICAGSAVLLVLTVRRRADEAHLLWVLAIATENQMSLPDELDVHALSLGRRKRLRVQQFVSRLRSGIALSDALREFPGLVPRFAVLAVQVAEPLGTTAKALRDAAVRHTASIRNTTTASSVAWFVVYYSLVVTVLWGMFAFQMIWVAPKLLQIFEDVGVDLPNVTVGTIQTVNSGVENALLLAPLAAIPVAVLAVLAVGYYRGWSNLKFPPERRRVSHAATPATGCVGEEAGIGSQPPVWRPERRLVSHAATPASGCLGEEAGNASQPPVWRLIGQYWTRSDTPSILRNLAETVSTGQPLQVGLGPMAEHHHRPEVGQRLAGVRQSVEQGDDCWQALRIARFIRPQEETLLSAAARAGNLPWALNELADEIERRQRLRILAAFELIRPMFVLAIGLAVSVYCLAWFMPLVQLIHHHAAAH